MRKRSFLIRFDDICPTMDWNQWGKAYNLMKKYNIKPLIGVIPDCKDPKLMIDPKRDDFWEYVRSLKAEGYAIAMHGYRHVYETNSSGIVGVGNKSEFAGLNYEEQFKKLKEAKQIFIDNGIDVDIFFAPSHSYDSNTLKALSELGFRWVSDGKSLKAKRYGELTLLPCISGGVPKLYISRFVTVVNHAQEWSIPCKAKGYDELKTFCEKNSDKVVSFNEFYKQRVSGSFLNNLSEQIIVYFQRNCLPKLSKVKRMIWNRNERNM